MSEAEKRSVVTDALATLGTIIIDGDRDAIHLAVEPVEADEPLWPGQHIGLANGKATTRATKLLGIVDPFLNRPAQKGEKFWLIVYPRQITSLRHVWEHPDFTNSQNNNVQEESRIWLQNFANRLFSYEPEYASKFDALMSDAEQGGFGSDIEYGEDCQPNDEFWMHFERYTGRPAKNKPAHFRCAC